MKWKRTKKVSYWMSYDRNSTNNYYFLSIHPAFVPLTIQRPKQYGTRTHTLRLYYSWDVLKRNECAWRRRKKLCTNFVLCIFVRTHSNGAAVMSFAVHNTQQAKHSARSACVSDYQLSAAACLSHECARWATQIHIFFSELLAHTRSRVFPLALSRFY